MTCPIKFRAWSQRYAEMTVIADLYWFEEQGVHDAGGDGHTGSYVLMQFTGLTDCNGTDIYEGDVVEWATDNHGGTDRMEVTIEQMEGIVRTFPYVNTTTEVIGNVHENPDLLERLS